ncbi:phage portal protein [Rhodopila sp.]|uniref:phage portal protein n=1 Tax=Rhodopila sp. TaxID=2480087 RepID=UPI003D0DEDA5
MFDTLCELIPTDRDYPDRVRQLNILNRVLAGTLYDILPYHFHEERSESGEYIPLRKRRPSVRYPLCRIVVEDSVSLLFSEGHFPTIDSTESGVRQVFADIVKESHINTIMIDAAVKGAVGSVALLMRVLKGRIFIDVLATTYLTPSWNLYALDTLSQVDEQYKTSGADLVRNGYTIEDPSQEFWFARRWDTEREIWFEPSPVGEPNPFLVDNARTVVHKLGIVPIVWIKNLPGMSATGNSCDGGSTFAAAMHTQVEIDYQLSQVGRGLKYSSDPTLLLKDPALHDTDIIKGAGNALIVSEKGDARLLEIGGTACNAVIDYVRNLRELALESIHGSRASPERMATAQSGRALELLNQGLIWLADNLRVSYGEVALIQLARLIARASQTYTLVVLGKEVEAIDPGVNLSLKWPRWYPLSADDRQKDAQSLTSLVAAGCISRETVLKAIASSYDIEFIEDETQSVINNNLGDPDG